ncbi:MAG: bifunctional riboflavin kinase/FAD synthetase [Actinomycetota bacterium]|nr:bifunctional riboflavin kinase/FAD synthetase [Actinomycetota bacterium]
MIIYQGSPLEWDTPESGSAVAIGVFDGVHLGHRRVLDSLGGGDAGLARVAMTFATHPASLLSPDGAPPRLSTLKRRFSLFADAGIDRVAVLSFDEEMRALTSEDFVRRFLIEGLNAKFVVVGVGFRFGRGAAGTTDTLIELGQRNGFQVRVVDIACDDGTEIRSTAIREALHDGSVERAAAMLGRPYDLEGIVVPGDGRGREIGVPTANVSFPAILTTPRRGVYAVTANIDGVAHAAVANLGTRPTFGGEAEVLEVHVLGLDRDLYGKHLSVEFLGRIRDERRFESVEDLLIQIRMDIATAAEVLADHTS